MPRFAPPPVPTRWFLDRPVAVKVGAALGLLAVVAIGLTGVAADKIGQLRDAEQVLYSDTVLPLTELSEIQRSFQGDRARVIQYGFADADTRATVTCRARAERITRTALAAGTGSAQGFRPHQPELVPVATLVAHRPRRASALPTFPVHPLPSMVRSE